MLRVENGSRYFSLQVNKANQATMSSVLLFSYFLNQKYPADRSEKSFLFGAHLYSKVNNAIIATWTTQSRQHKILPVFSNLFWAEVLIQSFSCVALGQILESFSFYWSQLHGCIVPALSIAHGVHFWNNWNQVDIQHVCRPVASYIAIRAAYFIYWSYNLRFYKPFIFVFIDVFTCTLIAF